MSDKSIPFKAPMIRAILSGTKSQTRRALKLRGYKTFSEFQSCDYSSHHWTFRRADAGWCDYTNENLLKLLPYQVGDMLWVREAWRTVIRCDDLPPRDLVPHLLTIAFEADGKSEIAKGKLRPGMFMPRWMSRITLRVTAVKVERLQDISHADVMAEGISDCEGQPIVGMVAGYYQPFAQLWSAINGPDAWEQNPYVVAYSFERVKP